MYDLPTGDQRQHDRNHDPAQEPPPSCALLLVIVLATVITFYVLVFG